MCGKMSATAINSHPSFPNLLRHSSSSHFPRISSMVPFTIQETPSSKMIRFRTKYSHFIFGTVMLLNHAALRHSEYGREQVRLQETTNSTFTPSFAGQAG